jgi:hypothetical protein
VVAIGWFGCQTSTTDRSPDPSWFVREAAFDEASSEVHAAVTAAYHEKYDRYGPRIVGTVVSAESATTTLRGGSSGDDTRATRFTLDTPPSGIDDRAAASTGGLRGLSARRRILTRRKGSRCA